MWKFTLPADAGKAQLDEIISASAGSYIGIPGLIRKYYGYAFAGGKRELVGIYLWQTKAHSDAFYTSQWVEKVATRWGAMPERHDWETPTVVESALGGVIGK
jgi:hypothetical protein